MLLGAFGAIAQCHFPNVFANFLLALRGPMA